MAASIASASILLIDPAPELHEIIRRYFSSALVNVCSSYKKAVMYIPLNLYQVVICPQRIASVDGYSLLSLNRLHHPCSPFIVTTEREEVAAVRQAIEQGALGFLHGTTTTPNIICIIEDLLSLYQLRCSLERGATWTTKYSHQLRRNLIRKSRMLSDTRQDNRVMCEQTLTAVEGSTLAFQAQANHLLSEARQRMWEY
ncbi:MAG: response regulator [Nitrospira sp.]